MNISAEGVGLIKRFEGCELEAYRDSVGVWTIGYGSTRGVHEGDAITQEEAERRLLSDLETVEITQGQYDALCSFVFNLGCGALRGSHLLSKLNDGDDEGAAAEILRWNHAGGRVLAGLTDRRRAEHDLFIA